MTATPSNSATREQIIALQTLFARWASHSLDCIGDARAARLQWASEAIGRDVHSFSDLTRDEGRRLIDALKESMGQPVNDGPDPWRKVRSRDRGRAAGRAGRRGERSSVLHMAGPDDFARIAQALRRLGWTTEQYEAWLKSDRSPIAGGNSASIRTVGDANRIWWALKAMLQRAGRWYPGVKQTVDKNSAVGQ